MMTMEKFPGMCTASVLHTVGVHHGQLRLEGFKSFSSHVLRSFVAYNLSLRYGPSHGEAYLAAKGILRRLESKLQYSEYYTVYCNVTIDQQHEIDFLIKLGFEKVSSVESYSILLQCPTERLRTALSSLFEGEEIYEMVYPIGVFIPREGGYLMSYTRYYSGKVLLKFNKGQTRYSEDILVEKSFDKTFMENLLNYTSKWSKTDMEF